MRRTRWSHQAITCFKTEICAAPYAHTDEVLRRYGSRKRRGCVHTCVPVRYHIFVCFFRFVFPPSSSRHHATRTRAGIREKKYEAGESKVYLYIYIYICIFVCVHIHKYITPQQGEGGGFGMRSRLKKGYLPKQ